MRNLMTGLVMVAIFCGVTFAEDGVAENSAPKFLELEKAEVERPVNQGHTLPEFRRRVPDGFAKLINKAQQDQVYAIQQEYHAIIETLKARIAALEAERSERIEMVLDEKQREEWRRAREEFRERRRAANENRAEGRRAANAGNDE